MRILQSMASGHGTSQKNMNIDALPSRSSVRWAADISVALNSSSIRLGTLPHLEKEPLRS
jgi:hypothetical protein